MKEVMTGYRFYSCDENYDIVRNDLYGNICGVPDESDLSKYIDTFEDSYFYRYYVEQKTKKLERRKQKRESKQAEQRIKRKIKEVSGIYK